MTHGRSRRARNKEVLERAALDRALEKYLQTFAAVHTSDLVTTAPIDCEPPDDPRRWRWVSGIKHIVYPGIPQRRVQLTTEWRPHIPPPAPPCITSEEENWWTKKYGVPFGALSGLGVLPLHQETHDLARAAREIYADYQTMVKRQTKERRDFFRVNEKGARFRMLLRRVRQRNRREGIVVKTHAEEFLDRHIAYEECTLDLLRALRRLALTKPVPRRGGGPREETGMLYSTAALTAWMRTRHRSRGKLDGNVSRADVAWAQERLGYDLSALKGDPADTVRQQLKRFWARLGDRVRGR